MNIINKTEKLFAPDIKQVDLNSIKYRFYVFDTETTSLEPMPKNFVFGVVFGYKYKRVIYSVEDFKKEFEKKRYKGKFVFAHNAEFDLMTIYGNIYRNLDNSAIFNGGFVLAKKNEIIFGDSMNLFSKMSVKKIGEMINLNKIDNVKVKNEGLTKENLSPEDIEYCETDCKIIWIALRRLFESIGNIKTTLPSLSLWDYRHNYLKEAFIIDKLVYDFYESYYGGRCEAFKIGLVNRGSVYDINSMYPFVMRNTVFPDPSHLKKVEKPTVPGLLKLLKYYEGFAKVTVNHKESFFGYLPVKVKIKNFEKLIFPIGTFETVVNFNELRFAYESGFIEILDCETAVFGKPVESPFVEYIDNLYYKKENAKDTLSSTMYKLRMNALYGKFGQKTKFSTVYFDDYPFNLIKDYKEKQIKFTIKVFNKVRTDCFIITENDEIESSFYSIPVYASYITSEARIYLLKHLLINQGSNIVYCDTDSIFLEGEFSGAIGSKLGEFKKEDKIITQINGLKNYEYEKTDGTKFRVLKGVNRFAKKQDDNETDEPGTEVYYIKKYYKTLQSLRYGTEAGEAYTLKKVIRSNYDKRRIDLNGNTRPLIMPLKIKIDNTMKNKEPENFYEAVLKYFADGGKVSKKDLISYVTGKSSESVKKYHSLVSETGISFDSFNERVPESFAVPYPIEELTFILLRFNNRSDMKKELKRISQYQESFLKDIEIFEDTNNKPPF